MKTWSITQRLGIGALVAILALFIPVLLGLAVYGLYLAFSASILLGVIVLVIEPLPVVIGLVGLLGHPELCERVARWVGFPI